MTLLPATLLNKRYRIVQWLAQGQYSTTYRAYDTQSHIHVAIKEYRDPQLTQQTAFRAEARRLSRLNHKQLPNVLDHFTQEGVGQYLITEYIDGVDLQTLVNQYGPISSEQIIIWLQAVCDPLAYLHRQGMVHLNIKPANIRITPSGTVFLVDDGLVGLGIHPHEDGYGAPEHQTQTEVDPRSDIYSLGATLYTLLTAKKPPNVLAIESGLADLRPAREVNPNVEPYLSLIAGRAMSSRPDARYDTADEFARALNRPASSPAPTTQPDRLLTTHSAPPVAPKLPQSRRRQIEQRTIYGLLGLLAFLLVGLFGFTYVNLQSEDEPIVEQQATATYESAIIAALTAVAPTPTFTPDPTLLPTATPEPLITETGARMLFMPAGIVRVGNDEGENNEKPSQIVNINAYFIDETEVTNGQYALCVGAGVCNAPQRTNSSYYDDYYGNPLYDDYPVIFVSWYQAQSFCEWRGGRLPSEVEWEKAAGYDPEQAIKLRYPWGDAFDGTKNNFCDVNCPNGDRIADVDDNYRDTAPVGSYADGRSPVGAYDMAGNVMEWVGDWYDPRYYQTMNATNPMGPADGEFKSLRGGSWLSTPDELLTTTRGSFDPRVARATLGFRCAMDAP